INRWLFQNSSIAVAYRDLEVMEQILAGSGLDWHCVRPTTLVNGRPTGRVTQTQTYGLLARVRRADVASWMLDTLERDPPLVDCRTPMIRSGGAKFETSESTDHSLGCIARDRGFAPEQQGTRVVPSAIH
ncbi:MAG: NAD(P)H-binding protein, partial [Planctomycetota bacterium]